MKTKEVSEIERLSSHQVSFILESLTKLKPREAEEDEGEEWNER